MVVNLAGRTVNCRYSEANLRAMMDSRVDSTRVVGEAIAAGTYRLTFHVGEYFAAAGSPDACRFLREVPVVFGIDDPTGSYHVPLVVSPWSYSTYRGS